MQTDLIPTAEVAELCGVSVKTIHRWVDAERITPAAIGPGRRGARMFRRADVDHLLASLASERSA